MSTVWVFDIKTIFVAATKELYEWPSPSVCPSVTPFSLCSHHRIIMKLLPMTEVMSMQNVKVRGQGSRSQKSKPNFSRFRTPSPVWILIWWWNDAQILVLLRRDALFFSRSSVTFQGHMAKNRRFWPKVRVSGLKLQFELTNSHEMIQKAWTSTEEAPVIFRGHPSNFKVTRDKQIVDFEPNWAFPDCNSSLNSLMAMK